MKKHVGHCLICGRELDDGVTWLYFAERFPKVICTRCEQRFELCNARGKSEASNESTKLSEHIALYNYNEAMKDYLHRYKFMKDVVLAKVFRKELNACLRRLNGLVVPIPLHEEKLQERTFAQVDELLNEATIPYEHLLQKLTTESQSSKNRAERLATPQLFSVCGKVKPQDYIVFDDIYTTGTTIEHAKRALLEAGAKSVRSVSLIRG